MTRQEEIFNEVHNRPAYGGFHADEFIQGAEWADKHPREGLWDKDKVCKWLNGYSFIPSYVIKELCSAMEKQRL